MSEGPPPLPKVESKRVDIGGWFSAAWASLKPIWLEVVLAVLVAEAVLILAAIFCYVPVLIVNGPILGGLYVYLAKRLLGVPAEVGDVFKGFRKFGQTLVLSLVVFLIPAVVGGILFLPSLLGMVGVGAAGPHAGEGAAGLVGGLGCLGCGAFILFVLLYPLVVGTFTIFAYPLVMFRNMSALEALRQSFALTRPKGLNFFLLLLSNFLIVFVAEIVGTLLACLGALVTVPLGTAIVMSMHLLAYRDFVGLTKDDLVQYA